MRKQIDNAINWFKEAKILGKPINGCITGSSLLGEYWEGMDIDVFVYTPQEFINILWKLYYDEMFTFPKESEKWKMGRYTTNENWVKASYKYGGVSSIKFLYNTCININIIYKNTLNNIFDILASFDMDIIAKGYDLANKKYLDLGDEEGRKNKIADINVWKEGYKKIDIWSARNILRQFTRIVKYYNRGYNTDKVALAHINIIDNILKESNIHNSKAFEEILDRAQHNFKIVKRIIELWLEEHSITEKELNLIDEKLKEV